MLLLVENMSRICKQNFFPRSYLALLSAQTGQKKKEKKNNSLEVESGVSFFVGLYGHADIMGNVVNRNDDYC